MNWLYGLMLLHFNSLDKLLKSDKIQSACINEKDQYIWNTTGKVNFREYMNSCGSSCIGNYDCTVACVKKAENYSNTCCSCFGDLGECSVKNCFTKCFSGDTPPCEECISEKCDNSFTNCSGLDVPSPKK